MIACNVQNVEFIVSNTDVQSLRLSIAPVKIQIGANLTKGLGAGANPSAGREAALPERKQGDHHAAAAGLPALSSCVLTGKT